MSYDVYLAHYGIKRRSGRYPWGSGGQGQNSPTAFLRAADKLKRQGLSEKEIATSLGLKSTLALRNEKTLAKMVVREGQRIFIQRQKDSGMSNVAIAKQLNMPESTIRSLLKPGANMKFRVIRSIADTVKKAADSFGFVDVGDGVHLYLGVSETKLRNAVALLQKEGYEVYYLRERQLTTEHKTSFKVVGKPGSTFQDAIAAKPNITVPNAFSDDQGHSFTERQPIKNLDLSRIKIVEGDQGGSLKDGLIELRRTPDLDMGGKRYCQVRIGVEGTHYLKGMAIHRDDMPPGTDVIFYTNKNGLADPKDYLKPQEPTGHSPFGAVFKQKTYTDSDGNEQLSAVNTIYEEGDWSDWDNNLASQFLGKQTPRLAAQQLEVLYENNKAFLEDIKQIPNPTVKSYLLKEFSDSIDRDATQLQAAAMPRQTTNVLIPSTTIDPKEVYAPNYRDGEQLALVRYPHGGKFEIPILKVNNKNPEMRRLIGSDPKDAIGIHPSVAQKLSGADFDGDFVIALPNNDARVRNSPSLEGLKNFDAKAEYPNVEGMRVMTKSMTDLKMGGVSNLITDMTILGASNSEIARAVRHSMVVIDAEKHGLNWEQSYKDNAIAALKEKYQGGKNRGASTLLSLATSQERVPHRQSSYRIDKETGEKQWIETGESWTRKDGKEYFRTTKSKKLYERSDAHDLSSGTMIETVYADHSNKMKALANEARKLSANTLERPKSNTAARVYANEVASLEAKLHEIERVRPLQRKSQLVAQALFNEKVAANPNMTRKEKGKERERALKVAQVRVGEAAGLGGKVQKPNVTITPKEWEAIGMGAVSPTRLKTILQQTDPDNLRELSLPSTNKPLPPAKKNRASSLLKQGYTPSEVADALGASITQIQGLSLDD